MRGTVIAIGSAALLLVVLPACGDDDGQEPDAALPDAAPSDARADAYVWPDAYVPPDAAPPECGDGVTEGDEVCDDGNLVSGDGCNATCTMNDEWDQVATTVFPGDQKEPTLACGEDTVGLVFTDWNGVDGAGASVRLRLFGSDGRPRAGFQGTDVEVTVNATGLGHQSQPRAAMRPDGSFVVVWKDESNATGAKPDVRGRLLAADGQPLAADFLLSDDPAGEQAEPAVAVDADGGFLAVWTDNQAAGGDGSGYGIRGRLFAADGTPRVCPGTGTDAAFVVNRVTASNQFQPDVAYLGDRYLVVWTDGSGQLDAAGYAIAGIVLSTDATPLGAGTDFLVNDTTTGNQVTPRIGPQVGIGAVVVWSDDSQVTDLSSYGIRARLLALDGTARNNAITMDTGDFAVNTTFQAGQQLPRVAALQDGRFAVTWQDWSAADGAGAGIRARVFTPTGGPIVSLLSPAGDDFAVNTTFWDAQLTPSICVTGTWFFAAWEDQSALDPDTSGSSIRYRLLPGP